VTAWLREIEGSILERQLFCPGERVLVAVSGGVDSMVLLHGLHQLAPRNRWRLHVAHFNHGLRGKASDADERFVAVQAKRLGLSFHSERGDVKGLALEQGSSIETAARQLRHEFLARTARRLRIRTIALAHHADDQVELFFLRLLRGAGARGLSGMKWKNASPADPRVMIVRPLLDQSKAALLAQARDSKIRFREDTTNRSLDFQRNRIRHELLPLLKKEYQPRLEPVVLRTLQMLADEGELAALVAEEWLTRSPRERFETLPVAVQRRVLLNQMLKLNVPADFELVEQLRLHPEKIITVAPAVDLFRNADGFLCLRNSPAVTFSAAHQPVLLTRKGDHLFDGLKIWWKVEDRRGTDFSATPNTEFFDADRVGFAITLRHWRAGDRVQLIGAGQPARLQDIFMNLKMPRFERHRRIVAVAENGDIFWVEGVRIADGFKLTPATNRRLIWCWTREA
jgi:tRNA(Ile)-lysidine synthase